jgi:uncharacterized membrane protein YphA (DoxX/SURF4 family)
MHGLPPPVLLAAVFVVEGLFFLGICALVASRRPRLVALARLILGAVFALYGVVKLTGTQLHHVRSIARLDEISSSQLFWYFFGYSRPYVVLVGLAELAGALLLVLPWTRRLGTLAWLAFGVHITVLDFAYDVGPVRFWVLGLTACCVALVVTDRDAYRRALASLLGAKEPA